MMANLGVPPPLQVGALGLQARPAPLALLGGPIPAQNPFLAGSKLARIDAQLRTHPYHWRNGPTSASRLLTAALGVRVFKQEVCTVMKAWGHTRKKRCIVPARSRPLERLQHLTALAGIWTRDDQVRVVARTHWIDLMLFIFFTLGGLC